MSYRPPEDTPHDPFAEPVPPPAAASDQSASGTPVSEPLQHGAQGSGPAPGPPPSVPSYAPPPVFSAQHIPQQPPRPKNHRPLIIAGAVAGIALLAVLVVVIVVVSRGGSAGGGSPQEAAKGYLEALARGDADAALAFGLNAPGSTELLTDDILQQQIDEAPISDVRILDNTAPMGDYAMVHVTAKFGSEVSDARLTVRKSGGEWKIQNPAVKLDFAAARGANKSLADLTVFGKPTTNPVYVFPGWVDYGSSNANLTYEAPNPMLNQLDTFLQFANVKAALSPSATEAINAKLLDDLAKCTASRLFAPPGCPLKVSPAGLVDGTAQWGPLTDLSNVNQMFNPYNMTVSIIGTIVTNFTATTVSGGPSPGKITGMISGTADLSTDPPTVTYR